MSHIGNGAAALLLAMGAGGFTGCGGAAKTLSAQVSDELHADIEAVRAAVERDRDTSARAAVDDFRATVRDLAGRGDLDAADALVLLAQADRIAKGLEVRSSAKPSAEAVPSPPTTTAQDVDKGDDKQNGQNNGKGKGKGRKDG